MRKSRTAKSFATDITECDAGAGVQPLHSSMQVTGFNAAAALTAGLVAPMTKRYSLMSCWQPRRLLASLVLPLAAVGLVCCSSSDPSVHGVSGAVAGLAPGESVRLELNGGNAITVNSTGTFTFPVAVSTSAASSVTVVTQPYGQVCTVTNGNSGAITSNVTNVQVICAAQPFTVSGMLTGLAAGSQVVLEDNAADTLTRTADGSFSFRTPVAFNGTYAVTVATQPAGAICTVQHGTGAGVTANVTSIAVICSPSTFTLTGTLNNLASGLQVMLENNAADPLTLSADGTFTFSTPVAESGAYNVTVGTQPAGQTCSVTNGQGTQVTANVANITVTCSTNTYTIGGAVSGLGAGQQVTLEDNGGNALTLTANGAFTFTTPVAYGGAYTVAVGTQPTGLACLVSNGAGSSVAADVNNVGIDCVANTLSYTTPGSYTWTVPDGLSSIAIVTTGGGGGGGGISGSRAGQPGGAGAVVTSTVSVTPGQLLNLVVGGGGGAGANGPSYGCCAFAAGGGGGGGGSSNVDAGSSQIIAGGGGGGGSFAGGPGGAGGDAGGTGGVGGTGAGSSFFGIASGGVGGTGGIGGAGGPGSGGLGPGVSGGNGSGGAGGAGAYAGAGIPGGSGGSGTGAGAGASDNSNYGSGGGGGGYGGGGTGTNVTGGGAGGSIGSAGTTYAPAGNGGGSATNGGYGSIVITLQ
jgi:hypothetical protein